MHSRNTADGPESAKASPEAASVDETQQRTLQLHREYERLQKERKPIDIEEYKTLMQELPADLRLIDPVKDASLLQNKLKPFVEGSLVDRTDEIEKLRAATAKLTELNQRLLPKVFGPDAVQPHAHTAEEEAAVNASISELEKQVRDLKKIIAESHTLAPQNKQDDVEQEDVEQKDVEKEDVEQAESRF